MRNLESWSGHCGTLIRAHRLESHRLPEELAGAQRAAAAAVGRLLLGGGRQRVAVRGVRRSVGAQLVQQRGGRVVLSEPGHAGRRPRRRAAAAACHRQREAAAGRRTVLADVVVILVRAAACGFRGEIDKRY